MISVIPLFCRYGRGGTDYLYLLTPWSSPVAVPTVRSLSIVALPQTSSAVEIVGSGVIMAWVVMSKKCMSGLPRLE